MANPVCPTNCASPLPVVDFDQCNPQTFASEISKLYIAKAIAVSFTDVTDIAEWTPRLSETSTVGDDTIRPLTVMGDKPAATATVRVISGGREIRGIKSHVLNITIDEVTPQNYEFMRTLECGAQYKIWYETLGGMIYGGNDGIIVTLNFDDVLNRGIEEIETLAGQASWKNKFHPERNYSPFGPLASLIAA